MIAELRGVLAGAEATSIVLDVSGVGYQVFVPTRTVAELPTIGEKLHLYTFQVVREDSLSLYGFFTREERHLFSVLLTVSGIGPKVALSLLSGFPLERLVSGITQGQIELISSVPGIGKKTAQRLVVELREKVSKLFGALPLDGKGSLTLEEPGLRDAISALVTLGYSPREAREAIQNVGADASAKSIEEVIRSALKVLS